MNIYRVLALITIEGGGGCVCMGLILIFHIF